MSKPAFTPGPWRARALMRSLEIFWPVTGKKVASVPLQQYVENSQNEANAALIAAAPEMYEALIAVMVDVIDLDTDSALSLEAGRKVQDALARAEGR